MSTSRWPTSSPDSRIERHRHRSSHRCGQLAAVLAHPPAGIAVGGHCIPVYPRFYLLGDPQARLPWSRARSTRDAGIRRRSARRRAGGRTGWRPGADTRRRPTAATSRRRHSRGRSRPAGSSSAGARPLAADPLYYDAELRALGFEPWDGGQVDAAIVQADHAAYARLTPADVPGVRVMIDGRGVIDPGAVAGGGHSGDPPQIGRP